MVRQMRVEAVDAVPRPVIAVGNDYPTGHVLPPHNHRRGQFMFSTMGALILTTPDGTWLLPPQRGLWIPPGVTHAVRVIEAVSLRALYLEPDVAAALPGHCQVVGITPLMRQLLGEAVDLPVDYDPASRTGAMMSLLLHELQQLESIPLSLPFPTHPALAARCQTFIAHPTVHETIEGWTHDLGMSRRAFTRLFRAETGQSFVAWRQQACLFAALPRLSAGIAVTTVALDLGYDNPAAFTTMFKRVLGSSPREYLKSLES